MTIYYPIEYRGGVDHRNMWRWSVEEWDEYCRRYAETHKREIEQRQRQDEAARKRAEHRQTPAAQAKYDASLVKNKAGWERHPSTIERMQITLIMRNQGKKFKEIGDELGVSVERTRQIYLRALRLAKQKHLWPRGLKSRPLDMGGPRDVWLTYYPSPDPRLDNMEPVRA